MRTTLVLDDSLVRRAKKRAADAGLTLSELVNLALRDQLAQPEAKAPHFAMITFGREAPRVQHEPRDFAEALEPDETAALQRGR
jgi:antitoxin component of RelBE/YafQ-DinJ toxin-antitoxin module